MHRTNTPDLEVIAHVININIGHNVELLDKCRELFEYSTFIDRIRTALKNCDSKEAAIEEVVNSCIQDNILADILRKEKMKIMASILAEFNEVGYAQMLKNEGIELGIELGIEQGLELGMDKINILNQKLIADNRNDDLIRSFNDSEFQQMLLREYGLM